MRVSRRRLGIFCVACWLLAAPAARADDLLVFAAASLTNALDDAAHAFEAQSGDKIAISYASSSALAKQIENGAPADIFISADLDWMDYVEKKGLVKSGTRADLVGNKLVLIAPVLAQDSVTIAPGFPLASLLVNGRLAMADPDAVPAGKYGKAALQKLGVWDSVANRIARAEDVRAALRFVSRGEAPLGIVYQTDAAAEKLVKIVGYFPAGSYPPIIYPIAALTAGPHRDAATFIAYLRSPEARQFFTRQGFSAVE